MFIGDFDRIQVQFDLVGLPGVSITFLGKLDHRFRIGHSFRELLDETNVVERIEHVKTSVINTKSNETKGEDQKRSMAGPAQEA